MTKIVHNFHDCLRNSHEAEDLPLWEETYRRAFRGFVSMQTTRDDKRLQARGIDRIIELADNPLRVLVDEKIRGRNRVTGRVYDDILLEYWSNKEARKPGWVAKTLWCHYVAYAIAPLGRCYLLPVHQLREAWRRNGKRWVREGHSGEYRGRRIVQARTDTWHGGTYTTESVTVTARELMDAIRDALVIPFSPLEMTE